MQDKLQIEWAADSLELIEADQSLYTSVITLIFVLRKH